MKTLSTKAVVEGPNKGDPNNFYYREEHEWRNINDPTSSLFDQFMRQAADMATNKRHKNKTDNANLTATLTAWVDGKQQPDLVVTGVTYAELLDFEEMSVQFGSQLAGHGRANQKQKHGQGQGQGHGKP